MPRDALGRTVRFLVERTPAQDRGGARPLADGCDSHARRGFPRISPGYRAPHPGHAAFAAQLLFGPCVACIAAECAPPLCLGIPTADLGREPEFAFNDRKRRRCKPAFGSSRQAELRLGAWTNLSGERIPSCCGSSEAS